MIRFFLLAFVILSGCATVQTRLEWKLDPAKTQEESHLDYVLCAKDSRQVASAQRDHYVLICMRDKGHELVQVTASN